jgi:hypothetical protein
MTQYEDGLAAMTDKCLAGGRCPVHTFSRATQYVFP